MSQFSDLHCYLISCLFMSMIRNLFQQISVVLTSFDNNKETKQNKTKSFVKNDPGNKQKTSQKCVFGKTTFKPHEESIFPATTRPDRSIYITQIKSCNFWLDLWGYKSVFQSFKGYRTNKIEKEIFATSVETQYCCLCESELHDQLIPITKPKPSKAN